MPSTLGFQEIRCNGSGLLGRTSRVRYHRLNSTASSCRRAQNCVNQRDVTGETGGLTAWYDSGWRGIVLAVLRFRCLAGEVIPVGPRKWGLLRMHEIALAPATKLSGQIATPFPAGNPSPGSTPENQYGCGQPEQSMLPGRRGVNDPCPAQYPGRDARLPGKWVGRIRGGFSHQGIGMQRQAFRYRNQLS